MLGFKRLYPSRRSRIHVMDELIAYRMSMLLMNFLIHLYLYIQKGERHIEDGLQNGI